MKKLILTSGLAVLTLTASATLVIHDSWTVNQTIPDGNPAGLALAQGYSGLDTAGITGVDVRLNITGGYNGDLYGYLVLQSADGSTLTSVLLNRVGRTDASGFGDGTGGFGNIVLSSTGVTDIHDYAGPGTYAADGRTVDPNGDFNGASRDAQLNVFETHDANGTWTLFLADLALGDQGTLVSWGLDVSVVPEPATWALVIFAAMGGLVLAGRQVRARRETV